MNCLGWEVEVGLFKNKNKNKSSNSQNPFLCVSKQYFRRILPRFFKTLKKIIIIIKKVGLQRRYHVLSGHLRRLLKACTVKFIAVIQTKSSLYINERRPHGTVPILPIQCKQNHETRSVFEPDPSKICWKGKHGVLAGTIQTTAPGDLRFIQ